MKNNKGQALVLAILLLALIAIIVPLILFFSQHDQTLSQKHAKSTTAFHLAEAGIEKAYLQIISDSATWKALQDGTPITGYHYDRAYDDLSGGRYSVLMTSGTSADTAVVISVGMDSTSKEVRTIKAEYAKVGMGSTAIYSKGNVDITGSNVQVELGAVISPNAVITNGRTYPQFWSASSIDADTNGATPPNCDSPNCIQWHSYQTSIPPSPDIDLDYYKNRAIASGTYFSPSYSATDLKNYFSGELSGGKTYYVDQSLTLKNQTHITGDLLVIGTLTTRSGAWSGTDETNSLPRTAWKQYGGNWSYYRSTYDSSAPAAFPGLNSTYLSAAGKTYAAGKVLVHGFLYVSGNLSSDAGGGNGSVVGAMFVGGASTMGSNSNCKVYYDEAVASNIMTKTLILVRVSWQEIRSTWPAGL